MSEFPTPEAVDTAACKLAALFSGAFARRDGEPVDVCRWHREAAEEVLTAAEPLIRAEAAADERRKVVAEVAAWVRGFYRMNGCFPGDALIEREFGDTHGD